MKISQLVVLNFRCLREVQLELNPGTTIIVGDNDAGKSTILEAIQLGLTCRLGGRPLIQELNVSCFNQEAVDEYLAGQSDGSRDLAPPEILIEIYFQVEPDLVRLQGTNNSRRENCPGIRLTIAVDDELRADFLQALQEDTSSLPVEYYSAVWRTFANERMHIRRLPAKSLLVDAAGSTRHASRATMRMIEASLDASERLGLASVYRRTGAEFLRDDAIAALNEALPARADGATSRRLTIALDEMSASSVSNSLVPMLDRIPITVSGRGELASLRIRLALAAAADAGVVLVEEPETSLSHTRMANLLEDLRRQTDGQQLIVTTHNGYVVNKLGLGELVIFDRGASTRLTDLSEDTQDFFRKLPGHDVLRMILAKKAILVEGASDELIVQRAFNELRGRLPLAAGVEVISIGGLSFRRFVEVAEACGKQVAIVTDNDGNAEASIRRFGSPADNVRVFVGENDDHRSLEDQVLAANGLARMNTILGKAFETDDEALAWMRRNKTEAALRVFSTTEDVQFPQYIVNAIDDE